MSNIEARCIKYGARSSTKSYEISGHEEFVDRSLSSQKEGYTTSTGNTLLMSSGTKSFWIYLYNFTELAQLPDDAKINSIKVNMLGGAAYSSTSSSNSCITKVMFIKDFATNGTTSQHTAVSTEQTIFSGNIAYSANILSTVTYNSSSTLVAWANENIATLKSTNFGIRINSVYSRITGMWIEVELLDGSLIYTGDKNITSAYLGNQSLKGIYLGDKKLL